MRLQGTWTDGQTDGRMDEGIDGRTDGRRDKWTDGWMDGQPDRVISIYPQTLLAGGMNIGRP